MLSFITTLGWTNSQILNRKHGRQANQSPKEKIRKQQLLKESSFVIGKL